MSNESGLEGQEVVTDQVDQGQQKEDLLSNLQLSDEAKTKIQSDSELLKALTHNIGAKREANSEAKRYREELEALKREREDSEKQKLKEQGEFKKLYEQSQSQLKEKDDRIKQVTINNEISLLAAQKGIKKSSYLKMFDSSNLEVDENLGVPGLEEAFSKFHEDNPDLFGSGTVQEQAPRVDTGKPRITSNSTIDGELQQLTKAARTGNNRDIARLREFKKANGLK